ncbi:MAG: sulfite exporter TauE/SafE family protein, partial [Burkholderiaceae bacterium]
MLTIALVGIAGVATAVLQGADVPLATSLEFSAAMVVGMLAGRAASRRVSSRLVQLGFSGMLFFVAIGLVTKA